jgi:hypothetical protein
LLQYRPVCVIHSLFYWSNRYGHNLWQNMYLLIDFSDTPHISCKKLHLQLYRSVCRRHDFLLALSKLSIPLNYFSAGFLQYYERLGMKIFQNNWMYKKDRQYRINHNVLYDNSKNQDENASISLTNSTDGSMAYEHAIIKPIGGGGRHTDVLKLSDITSSIISSSVEHTKFESFEFVDHLEISKVKNNMGMLSS